MCESSFINYSYTPDNFQVAGNFEKWEEGEERPERECGGRVDFATVGISL